MKTKRPTAPLSRQCGNGKRRRIRRKKSTGPNDKRRKRIEEIEERIPSWLLRQAERAKKS